MLRPYVVLSETVKGRECFQVSLNMRIFVILLKSHIHMSINRNASMRPETNPAGNLLQEISEAELNQLSAGAGEPRASWGDFCTSTLECTFGTMICCPPET